MKVYGKNVFQELENNLKSIKKIYISKNFKDQEIINIIKKNKMNYEFMDLHVMDKLVNGNHQGLIMDISDFEYSDVAEFYNDKCVVMLDHLVDPHNLGAIIRTCEAAGIKSIIIPKDRSVSVNDTVYKTSAGALSNVSVSMVNNLVKTINDFKDQGFFVYGSAMDGKNYSKIDYSDKVLLIIGNEGKGISRLVKENCDEIVSIPMYGQVNSLNASVAAGILIYDIVNR